MLTDQGGGADQPMGIFTGDFVFVGSIGRPDLLEEAAGIANTAEPGARDLFKSAERFKNLPDHLQVWPAHGAGSACGKGLGAIPSSTVGYEKLFNPSLQFTDEDEFVRYILADQPEAPTYFAVMKRVNKEGPAILGAGHRHETHDVAKLTDALESATVIDLSPSSQYATGHVSGTINIPLSGLAAWAGWLVDYNRPVYLICEPAQVEEAARILHKIGVEEIAGAFDMGAVRSSGMASESYATGTPADLSHAITSGDAKLLDVRSKAEWDAGHIVQADHQFLGRLLKQLGTLPRDQKIVVQCHGGGRSAIGVSVLRAAGFQDVVNLTGGYSSWKNDGLPVTTTSSS